MKNDVSQEEDCSTKQTRGKEIESGGANMASASEPKKFFGFAPLAPPVMILEGYISKYFVQFVFSKKPKN